MAHILLRDRKRRASFSPPAGQGDNNDSKRVRLAPLDSPYRNEPFTTLNTSRHAVFNSPEIFLHILSYLSLEDLIKAEQVCRYWKDMAEDSSLWREMYLRRFPYPSKHHISTHTHNTGFSLGLQTSESTELSEIEADGWGKERISQQIVDWKTLMRIGTNWTTGNASTHSLSPLPSPSMTPRVGLLASPSSKPKVSTHERMEMVGPADNDLHPRSRFSRDVSNVVASLPLLPSSRIKEMPNSIHPSVQRRISRSTEPDIHPQARVPRHLLSLAGGLVFVTFPDSPLLHVHGSYPSIIPSDGADQAPPIERSNLIGEGGALLQELYPASSDGREHYETVLEGQQHTRPSLPIALIPPPPGWSTPRDPDLMTAIAVDQRVVQDPSVVRVVVFYQSGGFVILQITISSRSRINRGKPSGRESVAIHWTREVVHIPPKWLRQKSRKRHYIPPADERVVLAALDGELLVGVTAGFYINLWNVGGSAGKKGIDKSPVNLMHTLHSSVAHWPASLSVYDQSALQFQQENQSNQSDTSPACSRKRKYTIRLGYCSPIYPRSWKPSVQDIGVQWSDDTTETVDIKNPMDLARTIRTGHNDRGDIITWSELVTVRGVGRENARVLAMDERWIVLAGRDNRVEVYETVLSGQKPEIQHAQTLIAHAGWISSIALQNSRCVTAGKDGRVLVWRLDRGPTYTPGHTDIGGTEHVELREGKSSHARKNSRERNYQEELITSASGDLRAQILPVPPVTHPLSLISAARELVLSRQQGSNPLRLRELAFNEDTIVGLIDEPEEMSGGSEKEVVRVWRFDA